MAAEQEASWAELPLDLLTAVLSCLPAKDLGACASVCTAWRAAADQEALWALQRQKDFPQADDATVAVLLERAGGGSGGSESSGGGSRRVQQHSAAKLAYWWLAREWTCERCQQRFADGTNSPSACCFHTGILFSGGLMNGEALRFTCCNRRAHQIANGVRDGNGCTSAFHCGGRSAWQRHSTGVKPRELPLEPSGPGSSSRHDSSGSSSSSKYRGSFTLLLPCWSLSVTGNTHTMNYKAFALLAILALTGSAAAARKRVNKKDVAETFPTVADALVAGNYTALLGALELTGLTDAFGPDFEGTIFAPSDNGFASLAEYVTGLGLSSYLEDPTIVAEVLKYHVLNTTVKAADLEEGLTVETLAGVPLTIIKKNGGWAVEDVNGRSAKINKPDIAAGNAIIHGINGVLLPIELPGAGNATEPATPEETETTAPEGTEVALPTGAASGLMASAAAVAASLVAAAFLA